MFRSNSEFEDENLKFYTSMSGSLT